jgi:hypothetical protein
MPIAHSTPKLLFKNTFPIIIQNLEFFPQPNNMSNPSNKKAEN